MYHRFSCSAAGHCEPNPEGEYQSLVACRRECEPHPLIPDLADLTYQYAPGSALSLPPRDQVRIVKQITDLTIQPHEARRVLAALEELSEEGVALVREPLLWPYLRRLYSPEVFNEALYDS